MIVQLDADGTEMLVHLWGKQGIGTESSLTIFRRAPVTSATESAEKLSLVFHYSDGSVRTP